MVGRFNCEQVHLLSTKQGKQQVARNFRDFDRNIAAACNALQCFSGLIDFHYKNDTFDFEMRIAYVNNKLTFHYCSHISIG